MLDNTNILITGGTGSFGNNLVKFLLKNFKPKKIIIYSRDELKQSLMQQELKKYEKITRYFIGDIRDFNRLKMATVNVDVIFHAAALKNVPLIEYNPFEAIKTNIIGAQNLIECSIENNVKKILALSTDKASSPINMYGATKLAADKLFIAANNYKGKHKTKFSVVRYGNVMGSRGSIIPVFLKLKDQKNLPITDKEMTRFNITLFQAVKFVLSSLKIMRGGEIFVPKIPSFKITDLAKAMYPQKKIKVIGLRPGEKVHEEMISLAEAPNTIEYKDHYIIYPYANKKQKPKQKNKLVSDFKKFSLKTSYNSFTNKNYLSVADLKKLLKINKFI